MLIKLRMMGMGSLFFLTFSTIAQAAAWQPVSGTHDGQSLYGLYPFEDGMQTALIYRDNGNTYTEVDGEWILSNSTDPSKTNYLFSFRGSPPQVDIANQTINLSGIYFHGVNPLVNNGNGKFNGWIYEEAIGWKASPSVWGGNSSSGYYYENINPWVPFVNHGNGTYTVTWSYANQIFSYEAPMLHEMSLTFEAASPVPVPPAIWLFISGLGGLIARTHWAPERSQRGVGISS